MRKPGAREAPSYAQGWSASRPPVYQTKHLHPIVGRVGNKYATCAAFHDNTVQVAEFARAFAFLPPHGERLAVAVEHLHAVIADLGHIDAVLGIDGDAGRGLELT